MATHLYDILDTGAGRVDYAWHVSGMPWVAVTDSRLSTYLAGAGYGSAAACFGNKYYSGRGVNYLTALDVDRTTWAWTYDDAAGLTGGNYSVNLSEIHPGVDWTVIDLGGESYTLFKTATLWGIPGVSQIFDIQNDTAIPYGNLAADIDDDDLSISVNESRGFWNYLDNLPATPTGAIIWIGHECIGITSWALESDGTITLTLDNVNKRGLFRTRPQAHTINEYAAKSEYVCPVPLGGIVGRPAQLWAFPATTDGASITYGLPTLMCHGKVSQGISIRDGVAKINVLGPLDWLKSPSTSIDYSGQLRRYVFQRGENDFTEPGTANIQYGRSGWNNKYPSTYTRSPHLLLYEAQDDGSSEPEYQWVHVWLCEAGSSVAFDTVEEVREALATELQKIFQGSGTGWESQVSGDGETGNPRQTSWHQYIITKYGIARTDPSTIVGNWKIGTSSKFGYEQYSKVGGPLASIFGLSHVISYKPEVVGGVITWDPSLNPLLVRSSVAQKLASGSAFMSQWGAYQQTEMNGAALTGNMMGGYMQYVPPGDLLKSAFELSFVMSSLRNPHDLNVENSEHLAQWFPRYYYEFSLDTASDYSVTGGPDGTGSFAIPEDSVAGTPRLFLERVDGQDPVVGAAMYLGNTDSGPRLECTISESGEVGEYYYVRVNSLYQGIAGTAGANPQNGISVFSNGPHPCLCWIETLFTTSDPWAVSQGAAPVDAGGSEGVELLKGVLGASSSIALSPSMSLTWVPELGLDAGCDGYSWIDWDDLEDKLVPFTSDERYIYRAKEQSYIDTLLAFSRSHGLTPYLELTSEANYDLWVMRFRPIGVINVADAFSSGRFIDSSIVEYDSNTTRDVASGYTYSSISLKTNYDGEDFGVNIDIKDKSAYAQNGYGSKTYSIEDRLTQCPSLDNIASDPQVQSNFAVRFTTGILPHISRARPVTTAKAVARALTKLPVGGDVLVTDSYGRNPFTAVVGYSDLPGIVTSVSVGLGNLRSKISWRLARGKSKGWAPALYIASGKISGTHPNFTAQIKNTALHEFSSSVDMVDAARYDCWNYDRTTELYSARSCDCGDYAIMAVIADDPSTAPITGTVSVNDPSDTDNTIVFTMDSTFSMTGSVSDKNYVILFDEWDNAEDCQKDMYVAFCGDDGLIGSADEPGDQWS